MIWIVVILSTLLLLVVMVVFLKRKVSACALLEVAINTNDGIDFFVKYQKRHPEMQQVEYVRLILNFAAKMLCNIGDSNTSESLKLIQSIKLIGDTHLAIDSNITEICRMPIIATESSPLHSGKSINAVLGFQSDVMRSIYTTIPVTWFENQFLYSWIAIVQTSIPKLDNKMLRVLEKSLKRMASLYIDEKVNPVSIKGVTQVPNAAFIDAVMEL